MAEHYLDDSVVHAFWDRSYPPRLEIDSGDTVVFECREASDRQVTPDSDHDALSQLDFSRIHPLTGPVFIRGAVPGDTLEVEVLELRHKGWGWNGHIPGFGLLAEDFTTPYLQHWRLEGNTCSFQDSELVELPFEPFCGVMGVAPEETGRFDTIPPRRNGGNLDIRGLTTGAKALFPVLAEGALFSTADCHAAQGDGEVTGTGIESPMTVTLRFNVRKDLSVQELQFTTRSPLSTTDTKGYHCTTAHGPDLFVNAQNAVRYMIDWLETHHRFSRSQAYCLCSTAADLKISEIVDAPNWIVSCYLPLSVLRT
ncbi:MAG: acetamidase/formamidase family protein [Trueperaceae bacterium]|nr:MAG: acetamidase/formamidase family protein [Trueperaceae bacterium]